MKLDLQTVLWRTRGRHWDYTFVLRPSSPFLNNWYEIHTKVFADVTPDNSPVTRGGVLLCGDLKRPYLATTFRDKNHLDAAERPVAHYIICFPDIALEESRLLSIPGDWGKQVVLSFGDTYRSTFDLSPSESQNSETNSIELPFAHARDQMKDIVLVGSVGAVHLDARVEVAIPLAGANKARTIASDSVSSGDDEIVSKNIESAIIEGEAYALGFKGYFGTLSILVSNLSDSDLRQRLAESFGGIGTDQFIETRMNDIRGRVVRASLPPHPRRGLESIVETLKQWLLERAGRFDGSKRDVAQLLGASVDDKVVESVVARLGSLKLLNSESR